MPEKKIKTFHFVETKWSTVKEFFPNAFVFTNISISNKTAAPNLKWKYLTMIILFMAFRIRK